MIREAKRARTHCTCHMNYRWPVSCFVIGYFCPVFCSYCIHVYPLHEMNYVYNIKVDVLHPFDLLFTVMGVNVLEQTDLIGDIQVFGGHKSAGNLENGIGCDTRHEVPPGVGTFLLVASSGIPEECY